MKNLPEGREWKTLGEIAELIMGQSPPGKSYTKEKKGIPLLNGAADFNGKKIDSKQNTLDPTKLSQEGDIIFCIRATIGNITFSDKEYCLGRGVCAIRIKDEKISPKYISYILEEKLEHLVSTSEGSTIKGIRKVDLERLMFIIPPLPVQKQIVSILERAEKLKEKRKQANEETSKLLQSIFLEMFGEFRAYPFKIFEELIQEQKLGVVKSSSQQNPLFKYNYFKMNNITLDGNSDLSEVVKVNASEEEVKEFSLQKYDFLFNTRNTPELVGKNCVFRDNRLFLFNNNIMRIRFKNEIKPNYINFLFNTSEYKQKLNQIKTGTTSVCAIYYKNLKKIKIPIPPIELQNQFALIVEKVESLKENQQKSTEDINQLFDALMQKAFNGELAG